MNLPCKDAHQRIKTACLELELALQNFDDDSESLKKAEAETAKLKEIKERLTEIKAQLDELSK